jgi:predicted Zn-dependent protease
MKMNFIRRSIFSLAFILLASLASAKELKSDELNYVITVPDGWTVTFQNAAGFEFSSPDRKKDMSLLIRNVNFGTLDSNSVAVFEKDLLKTGAQNISSKNITIDEVPAFETVYCLGKAPYATSFDVYQTIINNKLYYLGGAASYGDGTQDSEIKGVLASFHFLQQPKPSRIGSFGVKLTVVGFIMVGIAFWVIRSR